MNWKQIFKTAIISAIVFFIIASLLFAALAYAVISNAGKNTNVDEVEAINLATEQSYIYARDNCGYAGSMESMIVRKEVKDLKIDLPFTRCHYTYEFEFIAGYTEIEAEVNASTGKFIITDVERLD